jgi:hypothetical protein
MKRVRKQCNYAKTLCENTGISNWLPNYKVTWAIIFFQRNLTLVMLLLDLKNSISKINLNATAIVFIIHTGEDVGLLYQIHGNGFERKELLPHPLKSDLPIS